MSLFALVSTSNPICSPSIQWPHDIKNMLATVGLHLEVLQRLCGPHGAKAADAALALIFRAGAMCNVASDSRSRRQPFEITAPVRHVVDLLAPAGPDGLRINIIPRVARRYQEALPEWIIRHRVRHWHQSLYRIDHAGRTR